MASVGHPRFHGMGDVVLVLPPEHVDTIARDGWSKDDLRRHIQKVTTRPLSELAPDGECLEGLPLRLGHGADPTQLLLPKFRSPDAIHVVVAGGPAGKFAAVIGGWVAGPTGSIPVTRRIGD
jgi:hypothetical protein